MKSYIGTAVGDNSPSVDHRGALFGSVWWRRQIFPWCRLAPDTTRHTAVGFLLERLIYTSFSIFLSDLSKLTPSGLVSEVKKLYDTAYQLGCEESKEMTRGKYLKVLLKKPNSGPL